jgi:transposase
VTIVMGLDQHRGQITAEWIDTVTGEVSRARVAPAHREPVARFLRRFAGHELEVALEATTGWRFVVEEIGAVGGRAHLAEPAQTSALRGPKGSVRPSVCEVGAGGLCVQSGIRLPKWILNARIAAGQL